MSIKEFTVDKYGTFKSVGTHDKKNIILCSTNRDVTNYLISLKYRYLKEYSKIPHYIITKTGTVLQLLNNTDVGYFFQNPDIDIIVDSETLRVAHRKSEEDKTAEANEYRYFIFSY